MKTYGKISWKDRVTNEDVLRRIGEPRRISDIQVLAKKLEYLEKSL